MQFPLLLHGLRSNVGCPSGPDGDYLTSVREIVDFLEVDQYSDHMAVTSLDGHSLGHLSPVVRTPESLKWVGENIKRVRDCVGVDIVIETITEPFDVPSSTIPSHEFMISAVQHAECSLLLDVTNVLINSHNRGVNPAKVLDHYPPEYVRQIHVAGFETVGDRWIDTHAHAVQREVVDLVAARLDLADSAVQVTIERDSQIPALDDLIDEVDGLRWAANGPGCAFS